jgi:hypothetical protein
VVATLKQQINPENKLLIGSFQKDGDTHSGKDKWEKNPAKFVEIVKKVNAIKPVKVLLSGMQRVWVIGELKAAGIDHEYRPMADNLNDLYDCLDWYIVTSRAEGGPQAALECAYRKVNILSTDCGMASGVLDKNCICSDDDEFVQKIVTGMDKREGNFKCCNDNFTYDKVIPRYEEFFSSMVRGK